MDDTPNTNDTHAQNSEKIPVFSILALVLACFGVIFFVAAGIFIIQSPATAQTAPIINTSTDPGSVYTAPAEQNPNTAQSVQYIIVTVAAAKSVKKTKIPKATKTPKPVISTVPTVAIPPTYTPTPTVTPFPSPQPTPTRLPPGP